MKTVKFIYNDRSIEFLQGNSSIMVNATQMAKVFNKRIDFFLKSENTKAFIRALKFPPNGGNLKPLDDEQILKTRGRSGTFMHRILALKFAAWLDPKFELWVYSTIDKILFAQFQEIKDATIDKIKIEQERDKMREELLQKHPDDFYQFLELEGKLTKANRRRLQAIRDSVNELKLDLFTDELTKK